MIRTLIKRSSSLAFPMVLASCGVGLNAPSVPNHPVGFPVRASHPLTWVGEDATEFAQKRAKRDLAIEPAHILKRDHNLTKRVQSALDLIHSEMRKRFPEELAHAPAPQALVVNDEAFNVYVFQQVQCWSTTVAKENSLLREKPSEGAMLLKYPGVTRYQSMSQYGCRTEVTPEEKSYIIRQFNQGGAACQLSDRDGQIFATAPCFEQDTSLSKTDHVKHLAWMAETNLVVVNTGTFGRLNAEDDLVAILAHELSHFYRAHNTSFLPAIDFLYSQRDRDHTKTPQASNQWNDLLPAVRQAYDFPYYAPMSSLHLHPGVVASDFTRIFTKDLCDGSESCRDKCNTYVKWWEESKLADVKLPLPDEPLSTSVETLMNETETRLLACVNEVKFTPQLKLKLAQVIPFSLRNKVETSNIEAPTLGNYLEQFSALADEAAVKAQGTLDQAEKQHLGYYTYEQEADEMALEILSYVHVPFKSMAEAYFELFAAVQRDPVLGETPYNVCRYLFDHEWTAKNGTPVTVPIGAWYDVHHSMCYRIYNLDQEFDAHGYKVDRPLAENLVSGDWHLVKQEAVQTLKDLPHVGDGTTTTPANAFDIRAEATLNCEFGREFHDSWQKVH